LKSVRRNGLNLQHQAFFKATQIKTDESDFLNRSQHLRITACTQKEGQLLVGIELETFSSRLQCVTATLN